VDEILCEYAGMCLVSGPLGSWVASQKGRNRGEGFWLGLFLGPFGVLLEALLPTLSAAEREAKAEAFQRAKVLERSRLEARRVRRAYGRRALWDRMRYWPAWCVYFVKVFFIGLPWAGPMLIGIAGGVLALAVLGRIFYGWTLSDWLR
jgi:hypothetical protein